VCLSVCLSIYVSICPSIHPSIHPSIYLSSIYLCIYLQCINFWQKYSLCTQYLRTGSVRIVTVFFSTRRPTATPLRSCCSLRETVTELHWTAMNRVIQKNRSVLAGRYGNQVLGCHWILKSDEPFPSSRKG